MTDQEKALAEVIWTASRADESTISAIGADHVARAVLAAGYQLTEECQACQGSGLYPNPTGVFYAPTEWLGCPACQAAGRILGGQE